VPYPLRRQSRLSLSLPRPFLLAACALVAPARAANAYYFALQPVFTPHAAPAGLLVQSSSALSVPVRAVTCQ
jgi:hypothetical protein